MSDPSYDAARLRAQIRDGLGRSVLPAGGPREIDTLRIELRAPAGARADSLAPEIVAAIAHALGGAG